MAEPSVLYEVQQGVARITLNRPRLLNALDARLAVELADAAEAAARDREVWVVTVRGAGSSFSSGMDRAALSRGEIREAFFRHWSRALNCLEDMGKPALTVIHGYCLGGALQLALACDFRLAASDAVLGLGATRHGLVPDGAVLRLARVVGIGRAKELALLNESISAEEARAIGLVNWVVSPEALEATAAQVVEKCFHAAPTAVRHTKRLLDQSFHADPRGMLEDVLAAQNECMASWEIALANRAWDEKREAHFHPPPPREDRRDEG